MAVQVYAEYQREYQKMKFDRSSLQAKLQEDTDLLKSVGNKDEYRVSETEIAAVLVTNPNYHDLLPRQQMLQNFVTAAQKLMVKGGKRSPSFDQANVQLQATNGTLEELKLKADEQVRQAKYIELDREIRRLKTEIEIANDQVTNFEKEVASKSRDADTVGRSTVSMQMMRAKLDNLERILKGVSEERERLKVELDNYHRRVNVMGDELARPPSPKRKPVSHSATATSPPRA